MLAAAADARGAAPRGAFAHVDAIGFSAARQTLACVTATGETLGPALVWSDRRAPAEADVLARGLGGTDAVRARTGGVLDGAAVAAKAAWLAAHHGRWTDCRWLLTPRDLVVWMMTGVMATDPTMLSAAGLTDAAGTPVPELVDAVGDRLPPSWPPTPWPASWPPVPPPPSVWRPGCRSSWVPATGPARCSGRQPRLSGPWSPGGPRPTSRSRWRIFPFPSPRGLIVTRAATGGWLLEGGLSAAGSLLAWLSTLTGRDADALTTAAAASPIGARGVVALPWFGGARAPWWRPGARGAFTGLSFDHDPGDLARACLESVAREVGRCLDAAGAGPTAALALTGTGPTSLWVEIVTAVTGLPAVRRLSGQAASAGAALLASAAVGAGFDLDRLDPVTETRRPDPPAVARYAELRRRADTTAEAVVCLEGPEGAEGVETGT